MSRVFYYLFILTLYTQALVYSQSKSNEHTPPDPRSHNEIKGDEYIPVLLKNQARTPAYKYFVNGIITTSQVNVDGNGNNIVGDAANEPSIAVDPNNSDRIAIGWRQFNTISSNFRQAGYGFTTDGGASWTFPGVIEPGVFRSDPVLESDAEGNFYYNSLTTVEGDYLCHVFRSDDGGALWDTGAFAQGGDKQWMTIDRTSGPGAGHIYAFWTSYYSICTPGAFTRSTDKGESFEDCVEIPGDPYWGTLAVGPEGELYLGGSNGADFLVGISLSAQDSAQQTAWDYTTVVSLDGYITYGLGPNPGGLGGQTQIAVDTSGTYKGNVYLLCSVRRYTGSDMLDVMFARSTDGGIHWSAPLKINDDKDSTAFQWFGTMSVAPNGRIDVVWLDTRDNPGTYLSALYYANSRDGGLTWSENTRVSEFFDPHIGWPNQQKMGDYFDMISENRGAHLSWAATFNGGQDVYYSFIADTTDLPAAAESEFSPFKFLLSQNYPNPFNPNTLINYQLPESGFVTLKVYDVIGNEVAVLVNEYKTPGTYKAEFNGSHLGSGVYFYTLTSGSYSQTNKMILIK